MIEAISMTSANETLTLAQKDDSASAMSTLLLHYESDGEYPVEAWTIDSGIGRGDTVAYIRYITEHEAADTGDWDTKAQWQVISRSEIVHNLTHVALCATYKSALNRVMAVAYNYVADLI